MQKMKWGKYLFFVIAGVFFLINDALFVRGYTQGENESAGAQEKGVKGLQLQEKPKIRGYTYNLKRLLEKTQENIKKTDKEVDKEMKRAEIKKRNEARETKATEEERQKKLKADKNKGTVYRKGN